MPKPNMNATWVTAIQLSVIAAVVTAVIVLCALLGVFELRPAGPHEVTFQVIGSAATAVITYTGEDGTPTRPENVQVPWRRSMRFAGNTTVILTAGNPAQTGTIQCSLLLDGEDWKHERAVSPNDKVSCAGIVP